MAVIDFKLSVYKPNIYLKLERVFNKGFLNEV